MIKLKELTLKPDEIRFIFDELKWKSDEINNTIDYLDAWIEVQSFFPSN